MGFFSEFKSDLDGTDDVQEALEGTGTPDADSVTEPAQEASVQSLPGEEGSEGGDDFLSKLSQALNEPEGNAEPESAPVSPVYGEADTRTEAGDAYAESYAAQPETSTFAQQGGFAMEMEMQNTQPATDENAVITTGMVVNGDVSTTGNLELNGKVAGNVHANGKLTISGEIMGDSTAAEVYAESARITGEVRSQGSVKIGQSTVVIGNIFANGAVVAGAVKGDIDVRGPVILDTTAIVMGNIKSQSVQINNGAVIEGMCSQVYAEVNPSAFFENLRGQA